MLSFVILSATALILCLWHSMSRAAIALPVLVMSAVSFVISPIVTDVSPDSYFLICAAMHAMLVGFLQIPKQTSLNVSIQVINGLAILVNALGHALDYFGHPPTFYNAIILALGVTEFARLTINTKTDAREYGALGGYDLIRNALGFRKLGDNS